MVCGWSPRACPGARSASVGVWVGVGSVDETPRLAGASHYLEHLLFKGTKYRSGYDIADAVDAVGGELNAFTSHEYTCYYAQDSRPRRRSSPSSWSATWCWTRRSRPPTSTPSAR